MKRIVITGSESVGKTELSRRLAEHYGVPVSTEFVRSYAAERGGTLTFNDHGVIARGQMASEDAAIARAKDIVILDTDLVSTVVYCEHYFKSCPEWIREAAQERLADLYILLKPDIPWVADGIRDRGGKAQREEMHGLFTSALETMKARMVEVGGEREERFSAAARAIAALPN